ncbi:sterile alpha motif domain-containing protein 9-like [Polymixia lowei]
MIQLNFDVRAPITLSRNEEEDMSADIKEWTKHQVKQWVLEIGVDAKFADILFKEDIDGGSLLLIDKRELLDLGVTFGPAKRIIHERNLLQIRKEQPTSSVNQSGRPCKPYPFQRYHDTCRYMEKSILDVTESGATDYIEPCHEYKAFIHTSDENRMNKFTTEVIRFAAACMNSRTNGTIHFGVGDKPEFTHGQVLGVDVNDKEAYANALEHAIDDYFEHKHISAAKMCIKHPRFVEVLNQDTTSSEKYVIEVDIKPDSMICKENYYHIFSVDSRKAKKKKKTKGKETDRLRAKPFFVRDGSSSRDLCANPEDIKLVQQYNKFVDNVTQLSQLRKQAEEKHLKMSKRVRHGSKLADMITGGSQSLDKSHFERYVIVTNKSHSIHLESLAFLQELNPTAVLDFDPESATNGLQCHFEEQSTVNVHSPVQYKITEAVEDTASKLKLTRNTSWVFCNGRINDDVPSDIDSWLMDKGASVRDVISFLCRKEVLPYKRYLVIFLLLSTVSEKMDPLVETFSIFWQELKGMEQILCICENEKAFTCWKDLIEVRYGINISGRCIYERFSEVNGTILSLLSENRRFNRFLPCGGGSKVLFERKVEGSLDTLDVLCVNQCEGGNEDKVLIEENFYKGGKVSWWNFHFSEQPGSTPFIKRDKFDFIVDTVLPALCSRSKACVFFNLLHVAGCGGTTLAMHILWALKERFRCAVLKDCDADLAVAADQVVKLLMHDYEEELPHIPVLLMIDDFEDMDKVSNLQQLIEKECVKKNIQSRSTQVILLNCMRSESLEETERTEETVFIGNNLSEMEQKQFEQKLVEIEKTYKNAETFYGFMIMKTNFLPEYIQGVARNTLKSFNINEKPAQLIAFLVLLNVYCKGASLSVCLCEEFLGFHPKPFCGSGRIEDGFGKFSTLITSSSVEAKVVFQGVKMINSNIASHCLQELTTTYNVTKAEMTNLLLNTDKLYECTQGKDELMQDVHYMLMNEHHLVEEEPQFSPLIQHIAKETPGLEKSVLQNAAKRFEKDAIISQLLARYYYLKKKDFKEAKDWACRAKDLSRGNARIADTAAQVIKHELKNAIANDNEVPIKPEKLNSFLKMAQSAIDAFQETQQLAKKEPNCPFNASGCLGEIQVAVIIIEILAKTPIFSLGSEGHDIMSLVLSGSKNIQEVESSDPMCERHTSYYSALRQFDSLLYKLKSRMKSQFDYLADFYVNLGSRFGMKDSYEQVARKELFRCFRQYADLFYKTDSTELLKSENTNNITQVHHARQFLVTQEADTHSGILNCLSNGIQPEIMETIAKHYDFLLRNDADLSVKDRINLIYANVVLSCIEPKSGRLKPYPKLLNLLCQVLSACSDNLALFFIAVALLWPQQPSVANCAEARSLGKCVSQLKGVCNGKGPISYFFLGKKQDYERLIHLGEIKRCVQAGQVDVASLWTNREIWKKKEVGELLCRVTGNVQGKVILADTCITDLKVEVTPLFPDQLSGKADGSKVSFFIGFSMKGPVAINIY